MEFAIPVFHSGHYKGLPNFEESLIQLKEGRRTNLVADILIHDKHGGHICRSQIRRQQFLLQADLPVGVAKVTILNARVSHPRGPICIVDEQSAVLQHKPSTADDLFKLVETCTGLGSLGCGAQFAGFRVVAQNDLQSSFCEHLRQGPGVDPTTVVQGDICKLDTIIKLHAVSDGAKALAFGFSCQPFSTLGDMKEGEDDRSSTLSFGLYCGYLLQVGLIVMECTPRAPSSRFVKVCLQYFEEVTGFAKSEALLELADIWPSKRRRWWCILNHPAFGKIHINPMPKLSRTPVISDMFPSFLDLQVDEYQLLQLSEYERQCFQQFSKGPNGCLVDFHNQLDTALHSWGNQCVECFCGCGRKFSQTRLKDHGIFGALVHDPSKHDMANLRHLSAKEMALLCGFPMKHGWEAHPRFLTAGVGQLASSLQSAWVFSQIRRHLFHLKVANLADCQPKEILACVCAELFNLRDAFFTEPPTPAMELFREAIETMLFPPGHEAHNLRPQNCLEVSVQPEMLPMQLSGDATDQDQQMAIVPYPIPDREIAQEVAYLTDHCATDLVINTPDVPMSSQIWDENTGGCRLFSNNATSNEHPRNQLIPTVSPFSTEMEPSSVASASEGLSGSPVVAPVNPVIRCHTPDQGVNPLDLVEEGSFLLWDPEAFCFQVIRITAGQTVGDLLKADQALGFLPESKQIYDAVGQHVSPATLLADLEWGILAVVMIEPQLPIAARERLLRHQHRLVSLMNQGGAVALDEMTFYLSAIQQCQSVNSLAPLVISQLFDVHSQTDRWMQQVPDRQIVVTALLVDHHWIPFVFQRSADEFHAITTLEGQRIGAMLFHPATIQFQIVADVAPHFTDGCGFQAVAILLAIISRTEVTPFSRRKACAWRKLYWQKIYVNQYIDPPSYHIQLGAATSELDTAVATLLREHGVAPDQVVERAKQVISRLGASAIHQALQSERPWPALKSLANSSSPPFRLIQPAEFQQIVKHRSRTDKQVKSQKQPKVTQEKSVQFVPSDLQIPEGVFCQSDGHNLIHLSIRQVHPKARGVVLCTEAEVQPYLSQSSISTEGLAFLVMAPFSDQLSDAGTITRFPAQSIATVEPVLLTAVLIQKGVKQVQRSLPSHQLQIDQAPTRTLKLFLYRDQSTFEWSEVIKKPVKCILETLQCLQQCKQPGCTCPKWHEVEHEPLLDVWQRSFLNLHFATVKPFDAVLYTCAVRVVDKVAQQLFDLSGTNGVYVEPRSHDGKQHDPQTQTIWLPKHTFQQACAAKSTASVPSSLIRVGHRYGLRADTQEAAQLHSQFRPEVPYLPGSAKEEFLVGPLPWGTTRTALVKLFAKWEWTAKPLQPAGRSADAQGLMWLVHAMAPPHNSVYTMVHGDVLVVKQSQHIKPIASVHGVEASRNTKKHLRTSDDDEPGQLSHLRTDPWASAAAALPHSRAEVTQAQLQSIEASLEQKLSAKLSRQDGDTEMDSVVEDRVQALEEQMKTMQQSQQTHQSQTNALHQKVDSLRSDLDAQSSRFKSHLDDKLSEQMSRIEALFAKRARQE